MATTITTTIPLFMVTPGTKVSFPHRPRKKYLVRNHDQTYHRMRPGISDDYPDGRNFDYVPGTLLKDSYGRTWIYDSAKFCIEHKS